MHQFDCSTARFCSGASGSIGMLYGSLADCPQVPACLLIVRNSTDTRYYQRLQPYPRVLLRRSACKFKDYHDLPIAWGVVIFCIAKHNVRYAPPQINLQASRVLHSCMCFT